ncbi:hypothetical protein [Micromonospora sp. NPDC092111]|uniref:hypothetical protein n=1 Tax=Micromonospora sp. NPDC092111 TaxID=3364289 RepID=UPI003803C0A1
MRRIAPRHRLASLLSLLVAVAASVPVATAAAHAAPAATPQRVAVTQGAGPASGEVGITALTFRVSTGGPALNLRSCPRLSCSVDLTVPNGSYVSVSCQTTGDTVTGNLGTSAIWDRVVTGMTYFYASDTNIQSGYDGFHPGLPRC